MRKIILKYYLGFFIGFFLLLCFNIFRPDTPNSTGINILICLGGALAGALLVGTFYFKMDTAWGPSRRKKLFLKSPFTELFENGFSKNGEMAVGNVNGYIVTIYYAWHAGRPAIYLNALFDIGFHVHPSNDVLRDIIHRNPPANRFSSLAHEWTRNSIGCKFEYTFKPPSYEKLKVKADELTGILLKERLVPMSLEQAILLQNR